MHAAVSTFVVALNAPTTQLPRPLHITPNESTGHATVQLTPVTLVRHLAQSGGAKLPMHVHSAVPLTPSLQYPCPLHSLGHFLEQSR